MSGGKLGDLDKIALVGDIGGTNARFALTRLDEEQAHVFSARTLSGRDFSTLEAAIDAYCRMEELPKRPAAAAIAVAGPVTNGQATMTNIDWRLSEARLIETGFKRARLLNDFEALAMAAGLLQPDDLKALGPLTERPEKGPIAILGPGTGLGVSALAREDGKLYPIATEGGHAGFAPVDEVELELWRWFARRFGRVSVERIVSGPGMANLHLALGDISGVSVEALEPKTIVESARGGDARCKQTVERFCGIYGSFAGDVALTYGARGGVFLGGGMTPAMFDLVERSSFRQRFEAKGRFEGYLKAIPTLVITRGDAALIGAAGGARQ